MNILSVTLYKDVTVYDVLIFLIVVSLSVVIARMLRTYLRRMLADKVTRDLLNVVEKIVYYAVIAVGIISVFPQIGVNLTGLLVAGGIVGVIIGFASQSVVSNLISGIFLIFERPVRIGDQIDVEKVSGVVVDIQILSTIIRTYDGTYVRMPNEKVFSSNITNYVANVARRFQYTIGIGYNDDAEEAIRIIQQILEEHPFVLKNPSPTVYVSDLAESGVEITVMMWAPSAVWWDVKVALLWKIRVELRKAGIKIPFPQRVVHFAERKGEKGLNE